MVKEVPRYNISFLKEVKEILQNIKIKSNRSFIVNNQSYKTSNVIDKKLNENDANLRENNLTKLLGNTLYQLIHCRQVLVDEQLSRYNYDFDEENRARNFVELLSNANNSLGNWEPGWRICKLEKNGKIVVKKNELMIWALPGQFLPSVSKYVNEGDEGSLAMVREYRKLLPGFYMANGNMSMKDKASIVRVYWNVSSDGAVYLVKSLTTTLNNYNIPFQFKILNNENHYGRADAAVLYMNKEDVKKARNALSTIYHNIKSFLKPSVPLFAKRIASGISLAEDPSNGESFGQNRCRLFAESIYDTYTKNISEAGKKFEHVKIYFECQNVNFNKPYLKNTSSKDYYDEILCDVFG